MPEANQFQCYNCKDVFTKNMTDAEAETKLKERYPGFKVEDCELVCDPCLEAFKKWQAGQVQ